MTMNTLWLYWNKFWFEEGSPLPVAIYRILLGLILLYFCLWISPNLANFFGRDGIVSLAAATAYMGSPKLNLFFLAPHSDMWLYALFGCLIISSFCLTIGLFSRVSAFCCYILLLSFSGRDPFVMHPGFSMLTLMLLFQSFAPCGKAISVDNWLSPSKQELYPLWPQRLMQVQVAIVYWSAAAGKLHGQTWMDGTAVFYATHLCEWQRNVMPYLFDHLWTCRLLSWWTLVVELAMCTLVWVKELRYSVLLMGLMTHLGFEWAFRIPFFQIILVSSYVIFLDATILSRAITIFKSCFGRLRVQEAK